MIEIGCDLNIFFMFAFLLFKERRKSLCKFIAEMVSKIVLYFYVSSLSFSLGLLHFKIDKQNRLTFTFKSTLLCLILQIKQINEAYIKLGVTAELFC